MNVTANERRTVLELFNVAEAARLIECDVFWLHRMVKKNRIASPQTKLGKRFYYSRNEIENLKKQAADEK